MSSEEIAKYLADEWRRLNSIVESRGDLSDRDYHRWRLLRQIDPDTPEERGLIELIIRMKNDERKTDHPIPKDGHT